MTFDTMNLTATPIGFGPRMGGSMFRQSPFVNSMSGSPKRPELGENDQQWFARAKAAVAQYDDLWARAQVIKDAAYVAQLTTKYHANPEDPRGAIYRRNAVAYNVAQAESQTPVNYALYQDPKQMERVTKLEEVLASFRKDVEAGESAPSTQASAPSWLVPVGVGVGVLLLGALLLGGD